ncbi:glycosyltransferase family 2 protein [Cryobacterium sp. TMT2-15-1]|uniref:glycosyltransferase family 2 protein n=1 Tax=Cryobacterium sp. TMT2-15-1 TaxID=1259246 RepID=UPI00106CF203|nr:glycosyltransferase family 2 protein [Cryobacterium sp. TMT2-15-1]TFC55929.1 glycosyltransferase family 2 protein [Cryobacterium sp. TMT2-15-1]
MTSDFDGTLIVVPALNEEASVAVVVQEIQHAMPGIHCLVVDDGSVDATAVTAIGAGAAVLRLPFNLGVGGAMRAGFKYAEANGYSRVVQIDADGQHDPASVPQLLLALETADLVLGARFAGTGDYRVTGPRQWAMVVLARIISRLAHTTLTDTTSGLRASGPRAVRLFAEHYPAEYLGDTIESLVIAARAECRIAQIPVAMRVRSAGQPSHDPFKAAAYLGRACIALVFAIMRPPISISDGR